MISKDFLKKTEFKIFLTVYLVYLVFMTNYGGNFMADSMLSATISLVEKQTLAIDDYVSDVCKETGCDHSFYNGHYYSGFPPGLSFIALPIYLIVYPFLEKFVPDVLFNNSKTEIKLIILNILVTLFISSFLSALTSVLVYKISSYFTNNGKTKIFTSFILSFSTLYFLYSTGYYARVIAAFFSLFAFYKLIQMKNSKINKNNLFLSGLFSAIAISMDYPNLLITGVLFLYLLSFLRDRRVVYFIFGFLLPIILILLYHYTIFDNPFETPDHLRAHKETLETLRMGFGGFNYPHLEKLFLYTFSSKRGLFFYSPIFLLSLYGIYLGFRKNKFEILTIVSVWLVTFLLYSSSVWPWWWDGSFGPRYLIATFPYIIIPLNFVIDRVNKLLFYLLIGLSSFFSLLGVMFDRTGFWTYPFDIVNPIFTTYMPLFLERGFSNYTLNIITYKIINLPIYLINLIFFFEVLILALIIRKIWIRKIY